MPPATETSTSRQITAATTAAAGAIHVVASVFHFQDSTLLGLGFVAVGLLQLLLGATALIRPGRHDRWLRSGFVALNATALAAWAVSRTVGLPIGHPGPEPAALADLVTVAFELVAVGAAAWWATRGRRRPSSRSIVTGVVAAWSLSFLGAGAAVASLGASGHAHGDTAAAQDDGHHAQGPDADHATQDANGHHAQDSGPGAEAHGDADRAADELSGDVHEHDDGSIHLHDEDAEAHAHDDGTLHVHADDDHHDEVDDHHGQVDDQDATSEPQPADEEEGGGHTHAPGEEH